MANSAASGDAEPLFRISLAVQPHCLQPATPEGIPKWINVLRIDADPSWEFHDAETLCIEAQIRPDKDSEEAECQGLSLWQANTGRLVWTASQGGSRIGFSMPDIEIEASEAFRLHYMLYERPSAAPTDFVPDVILAETVSRRILPDMMAPEHLLQVGDAYHIFLMLAGLCSIKVLTFFEWSGTLDHLFRKYLLSPAERR